MIRVGKVLYDKSGNISYPSLEGYESIVVMMYSHSKYFPLSPYFLTNDNGHIMENIWQFSKIFENIPAVSVKQSRYNQSIIWSHTAETHIDDNGNITPGYWNWRKKGFENKKAVRYPVGYNHRSNCKYSIPEYNLNMKLKYIEARVKIYIPTYCELAKKETDFFPKLKEKLQNGTNLLILEVDGPHQESLDYYKQNYGVKNSFIENHTMFVDDENLSIMLNDSKHPFGHGYCLAMALLDIDVELLNLWSEILNI